MSRWVSHQLLVQVDGLREAAPLLTVNGGAPFAIAGIWDEGDDMHRCCLLTMAANAVLEPIHDRMPVIVRREDWEEWFSPGVLADQGFQRITAPYRAEEMSALAVSPLVNSARVDDRRCCEAVDVAPEPQKLEIRRRESRPPDQLQTLGF